VAEDFLDVPQVGLVLQKMRGATVPPQVTGDMLFDASQLGIFFDDGAEAVAGNGISPHGDEKPITAFLSHQFRPHSLDVAF